MRDIIVIGVVMLCAMNALRRPAFGILAFVGVGLLSPHSMTWGPARGLPAAQLIAVATLLGFLFSSEAKRLPLRRETVFLFALWMAFGLSTLFADYPDRAQTQLIHVSKILLMVFLSTSLINTQDRLRLLMLVYSLSLGFHGVKGGFFFIITGGAHRVWGPEQSFLEANNSIGLALAMNVPILLSLAALEKKAWLRRMMYVMAAFSYPAVIGTFSRGAWIGLSASTVLIIWTSKRRVLYATVLIIAILIVVPFLPERVVDRYEDLKGYEEEGSAQSRIWSWRFAIRVVLANPLFGAGFEYYGIPAYLKYWPEFLDHWPDAPGWSCHSIWFAVMSEHGFPAFALWVGLFLSALLSLRRMGRQSRGSPDEEWVRRYSDMLQIALVSFAITGTFLDAAYFDIYYQLIAVIIIMKEILAKSAIETGDSPCSANGADAPPRNAGDLALSS